MSEYDIDQSFPEERQAPAPVEGAVVSINKDNTPMVKETEQTDSDDSSSSAQEGEILDENEGRNPDDETEAA